MKFLELAKRRYSVRKYSGKKVPRKLITKCVEAAQIAPSAENVQPWRFLVVDDEEKLKELKKNAFSGVYAVTKWANSAPVIIVILAKPGIIANQIGGLIQGIDYYLLDIGIGTEHLVLQATELGLGTCWIGWFNIKKTRKILNIPKKYKIAGLMTLGYFEYKENLAKKRRKKLDDILFFNKI